MVDPAFAWGRPAFVAWGRPLKGVSPIKGCVRPQQVVDNEDKELKIGSIFWLNTAFSVVKWAS